MAEEKTFKVHCAHCQRPFRVRYPLVSEEEGKSEVVVECMYCSESVMIQLPSEYVRQEHLTRGVKSVPTQAGAHGATDHD